MNVVIRSAWSAVPSELSAGLSSQLNELAPECALAFESAIALSATSVIEPALSDHAQGLRLHKLIQSGGFDDEALARLAAMEVSQHLDELLSSGADLALHFFGSQIEKLSETLCQRHRLRAESSMAILGAATVFVLAAIAKNCAASLQTPDAFISALRQASSNSAPGDQTSAQADRTRTKRVHPQPLAVSDSYAAALPLPYLRQEGDEASSMSRTSALKGRAPLILGGIAVGVLASFALVMSGQGPLPKTLIPSESIANSEVLANASDALPINDESGLGSEVRAALNPAILSGAQAPNSDTTLSAVDEPEDVPAQPSTESLNPPASSQDPQTEANLGPSSLAAPVSAQIPNQASAPSQGNEGPDLAPSVTPASLIQSWFDQPGKLNRETSKLIVPGVEFKPGRPELVSEFPPALDSIAALLKEHPRSRFQIGVTADPSTRAAIGLAQLRAEALKRRLLSQGAPTSRIDTAVLPAPEGDNQAPVGAQVELALLRK